MCNPSPQVDVKDCSLLEAAQPHCQHNVGLGNHGPASCHIVNVLDGIAGPFLLLLGIR